MKPLEEPPYEVMEKILANDEIASPAGTFQMAVCETTITNVCDQFSIHVKQILQAINRSDTAVIVYKL